MDSGNSNAMETTMLAHEQIVVSKTIREQQRFLSKYNLATKAGDPDTAIIDHAKKIPYKFPSGQIRDIFFDYAGRISADGDTQYYLERQGPMCGIYVDFDIYQESKEPMIVNDRLFHLCKEVVHTLLKFLNPTPDGEKKFRIHAFATRRREITYDANKCMYKDEIGRAHV